MNRILPYYILVFCQYLCLFLFARGGIDPLYPPVKHSPVGSGPPFRATSPNAMCDGVGVFIDGLINARVGIAQGVLHTRLFLIDAHTPTFMSVV